MSEAAADQCCSPNPTHHSTAAGDSRLCRSTRTDQQHSSGPAAGASGSEEPQVLLVEVCVCVSVPQVLLVEVCVCVCERTSGTASGGVCVSVPQVLLVEVCV